MLSLILAASILFGTFPGVNEQSTWEEVNSAEGRFAASMPAEVRTGMIFTDTKEGQLITHTVSCTDDNLNEFTVSWTEYPEQKSIEKRGSQQTFERVRDAFALTREATVFQEATITSTSYPAKAYAMKTNDGHIIRMQIYFVKNRFYQVTADTRAASAADGERFLKSFKLTSGSLI